MRVGVFNGQRVVRATFHGGIVGDDHAFDAFHPADPGNHASGGNVFAVHRVGRQLADLEKRRTRIEQAIDPLTGSSLPREV